MNIQIELQRRPEDYRLDNCVIDVVEEIPHDSFETFQNYPTARYGAITNSLHRLPEDTKDERHCILLLDADGDEGFIVNPHGAEYARYSAFVPNARQLCRLAQYPSLNRFSSDMEKLVEHFELEILRNQKDGRYQFSMNTVSDYYLEKFDGFLDGNLFLNMLSERPEIVEVEEYCDELTAKVKPAFCKTANVRNLSQKELDVICANHVLWLNDAGGEQADLSNCVLRGLFLRGRDLSHAYCNNIVFDDCNLDSVDFSSAELESVRFTNCEMKDLFAVKTNFADAEFESCDLSDATIAECPMMSSTMKNCNLDNTGLLDCDGEPVVIPDEEAEGLAPVL